MVDAYRIFGDKEMEMKAYMGSSRIAGTEAGAILIFANNIKEAKNLAWNNGIMSEIIDGDYIDLEIKWLKNSPWLFEQMIGKKPHVIESPTMCKGCMLWGYELDKDDLCESCRACVITVGIRGIND